MIGFLVSFLIFICVVAVVILGFRWLVRISGATISPELNLILSIVLFIILLIAFLQFVPGLGGPYLWRH